MAKPRYDVRRCPHDYAPRPLCETKWCDSEFPIEGTRQCRRCEYVAPRLTRKGMVRPHKTRA